MNEEYVQTGVDRIFSNGGRWEYHTACIFHIVGSGHFIDSVSDVAGDDQIHLCGSLPS